MQVFHVQRSNIIQSMYVMTVGLNESASINRQAAFPEMCTWSWT